MIERSPHTLPDRWEENNISDVVLKTRSRDPRKSGLESFVYIDVSAVSNSSYSIESFADILSENAPSRARKEVRADDILFATVRPTLRRVALVPHSFHGAIASTGFCVLRPVPDKVDQRFLYYFLLTDYFTNRMRELQRGASYPAVRDSDVYRETMPIPPLDEQRNIAAVLSLVQRAIEQQERLIALTTELKKVLMHKLFTEGMHGESQKETEIGPVPESWDIQPLGTLAKVGNGSTPKRSNPAYWESGDIPWLNSSKIHELFIETSDQFVTPAAVKECHLPMVPAGSLLIAITGQGKTLGNSALVRFDSCINQHLAYSRFTTDKVVPEFVLWFMQTRYEYLRSISQAGGSTKGALTCGFLKTLQIPVPILDEQKEIADAITLLHAKIQVHQSKRNALEELFRTLLNQLMTAQIRVNDLNLYALTGA